MLEGVTSHYSLVTSSSRKARKEMTVSVGVAPGLAVTQHTAIDTANNIGLTSLQLTAVLT